MQIVLIVCRVVNCKDVLTMTRDWLLMFAEMVVIPENKKKTIIALLVTIPLIKHFSEIFLEKFLCVYQQLFPD